MNKKMPLSILMENARGKLISSFNRVIDETKLPAYLYEGMLLELLSEVRNRKNAELLADLNTMNAENTENEKETE